MYEYFMPKKNRRALSIHSAPLTDRQKLLGDIRQLIDAARTFTAQTVNSSLVHLYWAVGHRIKQNVLKHQRAKYGAELIKTISTKLASEYGGGFSQRNLFNMLRMAEVFPDRKIVQTLSAQLGWSHFMEIIYLKEPLQREFYAELCRIERWSVRDLREKINSMLFERTALSKKPGAFARQELSELRKKDRLGVDLVFRDPYMLDFLDLKDSFSEKDLENSILREIERFLLELGTDFSFVARQKRISVGGTDYYLDLLFFHRRLRTLVAIELKLGKFQPSDTGQMELYLRWLEQNEQRPGENRPLGIILCGSKGHEEVAVLRLDAKGIHVAEYLTEMPPRRTLKRKLHEAIAVAREQLARRRKP